MTITFEEAREIVRRACEPVWEEGTFCLDDRKIVENDEAYIITIGPRELLIDGDMSYARVGDALPVVSKADGTISWQPWVVLMDSPGIKTRSNPNPTLQA